MSTLRGILRITRIFCIRENDPGKKIPTLSMIIIINHIQILYVLKVKHNRIKQHLAALLEPSRMLSTFQHEVLKGFMVLLGV